MLSRRRDRAVVGCTAVLTGLACLLIVVGPADAAIVPTVGMGTAGNYAVLGAEKVTNTGSTILRGSLGLWPGTDVPGFPPGLVLPPGVKDITNAAAQQGQSDLIIAYDDAAGRPLATELSPADIGNRTVKAGVYSGLAKAPLGLSGTLTLDGENNASSVFIFQTDSTLITAPSSRVELINGALECNVFWQVGSSATLDVNSTFVGTILALTSVTVNSNVVVHGRALARGGSVTLDDDSFTLPACTAGGPTTTAGSGGGVTTTTPGGGGGGGGGGGVTTTTPTGSGGGGSVTTTPPGGAGTATTTPTGGAPATTTPGGTPTTLRTGPPFSVLPGSPGVPGVVGPPRTGADPSPTSGFPWLAALAAGLLGGAGGASVARGRGRQSRSPR